MKMTLPVWLDRLLGEPTTEAGEGASWLVDAYWSWAPLTWVLFLVFSIAWVAVIYAREVSSAGRGYRSLLVALRQEREAQSQEGDFPRLKPVRMIRNPYAAYSVVLTFYFPDIF